MDRPKRPIIKPSRYVTTSSDEAPRKRIADGREKSLEEDMRDLREVLDNNSTINEIIHHTNSQDAQILNQNQQIHPQLYVQSSQTYIPTY